MFYLRLNRIKIADNGAVKSGLGLFGHDFATVQLISFITTGNAVLPNLDRLINSVSQQERQSIVEAAVKEVVSSRVFTQIQRVTDHAEIRFGDTGYVVYESSTTPESFNWILLAIKSEQQLRDRAQTVHDVITHKDFNGVINNAIELVKGGAALANPALAASIQISKFVAEVTAAGLMKSHDKQLGVVSTSMDRAQHYIAGIRDSQDAPDSTGNMWFDYSIFAYERAIPVSPVLTA